MSALAAGLAGRPQNFLSLGHGQRHRRAFSVALRHLFLVSHSLHDDDRVVHFYIPIGVNGNSVRTYSGTRVRLETGPRQRRTNVCDVCSQRWPLKQNYYLIEDERHRRRCSSYLDRAKGAGMYLLQPRLTIPCQ